MAKVLDGLLYGLGGAIGAMSGVQIAKELSPALTWLFS